MSTNCQSFINCRNADVGFPSYRRRAELPQPSPDDAALETAPAIVKVIRPVAPKSE